MKTKTHIVMKSYSQKTNIFPLNEWIYFRLYTNLENQDIILIELNKLVNTFYSQKKLEKFFFVRYFVEFYELRIRLKFNNRDNEIFEVLLNYFKTLFYDGVLKDFSINIYRREIERYGMELINDFETVFSIDSLAVTKFLTIFRKSDERLLFSLMNLNRLIDMLPYSDDIKYNVLEKYTLSYRRLNIANSEIKSSISKAFRHFHPKIRSTLENKDSTLNSILSFDESTYKSSIHNIYMDSTINPVTHLLSIFHMHNNRLFDSNQKDFDFLSFEFLYRYTKSKRARSRMP